MNFVWVRIFIDILINLYKTKNQLKKIKQFIDNLIDSDLSLFEY